MYVHTGDFVANHACDWPEVVTYRSCCSARLFLASEESVVLYRYALDSRPKASGYVPLYGNVLFCSGSKDQKHCIPVETYWYLRHSVGPIKESPWPMLLHVD